jgi:hypothetical protein
VKFYLCEYDLIDALVLLIALVLKVLVDILEVRDEHELDEVLVLL